MRELLNLLPGPQHDGGTSGPSVVAEQAAEVERRQCGEQECHREHDPEVEQVDEPVERIAGPVLVAVSARMDADHEGSLI
jgi:hypothetical protein